MKISNQKSYIIPPLTNRFKRCDVRCMISIQLLPILAAFVDNVPLELSNLNNRKRFDLGIEINCVKSSTSNSSSGQSVVYHSASANQTDGYLIIKDMQFIRQNSGVIEYEVEFDAPIHSNRALQIPSFSSRIKGTLRTLFSAPY